MTVREDRLGLADSSRDITTRHGVPPRPRRPLPAPPPADADDMARYLRAVARLADLDDLDTASAACDLAVDRARTWSGDPVAESSLGAALSLRGALARRRGDLRGAERDGRAAATLLAPGRLAPGLLGSGRLGSGRLAPGRLASDCAPSDGLVSDRLASDRLASDGADRYALAVARRMAVLVDIGDLEDADAVLADFGEPPADMPAFRYVRGKLHAAAGRPAEALADFFHCGERLAARHADQPAILSWRSAAAAVLALIGTREAALRLADAEVRLCREAGAAPGRPTMLGRPSALGRALRVRGTVLGAPAGIGSLEEAVRLLESSPRRFEYARALVDWGVLLTAARRRPQARRVLREGAELAVACGSPALASRAWSAYATAGGKPR